MKRRRGDAEPVRMLAWLLVVGYVSLIGLTFAQNPARSPADLQASLRAVGGEEPVIGWALAENLVGAPQATVMLEGTQIHVLAVLADSLRTVILLQAEGPQHHAIGVRDLRQGGDWPQWYWDTGPVQSYGGGTLYVVSAGGAPAWTGTITLSVFGVDQEENLAVPANLVRYLPEEQWAPPRSVSRDGITVELVSVRQTPAALTVQFRSHVDPAYGSASPRPDIIRLADGTPMAGTWMAIGGVSEVRFRRPRPTGQTPALMIDEFHWTTDETMVPLQEGTLHPVGPALVAISDTRPVRVGRSEGLEVLFSWPDGSPLSTLGVRAVDAAGVELGTGDETNPAWLMGRKYQLYPDRRLEGAKIGLRGIIHLPGAWALPLHR